MTVSAEGECVCDVVLEQDRIPYMVYYDGWNLLIRLLS